MKIRNIFQSCKLNEARQRFAATKFSDSDVKDQTKLNRRIDNEKDEVAQSLEDSKEHSEQVVNISNEIKRQKKNIVSPKEQIERNLDNIKVNSQEVLNLGINSQVVDSLMEIGIDVFSKLAKGDETPWTKEERERGYRLKGRGHATTVQEMESKLDDVSRDIVRLFKGKAYLIPHVSAFVKDKKKGHHITEKELLDFTNGGGGTVEELINYSKNLTDNQKEHLTKMFNDLFGITPQGTGPGEVILSFMLKDGQVSHSGRGDLEILSEDGKKKYIEVKGGQSTISGFDLSVKNKTQAYSRLANYVILHCARALKDKNYGGHYDRITQILKGYGTDMEHWYFTGKPQTSVDLSNLHHNKDTSRPGGGYEEFFGKGGKEFCDGIIMFKQGNNAQVKNKLRIKVAMFDINNIKYANGFFNVQLPVAAERSTGQFQIMFDKGGSDNKIIVKDILGWSGKDSYPEFGKPWGQPVLKMSLPAQQFAKKSEEEIRQFFVNLIKKSLPDNMQDKVEWAIQQYS